MPHIRLKLCKHYTEFLCISVSSTVCMVEHKQRHFNFFFSFLFFHRILALEKLGAVFNQVATPLQYTPRKFVIHPQSNNLIIIESDHNAFSDAVKEEKKQQIAEVCSKNFIIMMNSVTLLTYYLDFDLIL